MASPSHNVMLGISKWKSRPLLPFPSLSLLLSLSFVLFCKVFNEERRRRKGLGFPHSHCLMRSCLPHRGETDQSHLRKPATTRAPSTTIFHFPTRPDPKSQPKSPGREARNRPFCDRSAMLLSPFKALNLMMSMLGKDGDTAMVLGPI